MHPTHRTLNRTGDAAVLVRNVRGLFKLRIGFVIMITALAGYAITPGPSLEVAQLAVLALSVLIASASAGAFNQYIEYKSDRLMARTRGRAFVTGALRHTPAWLIPIGLLLAASVAAAWVALNVTWRLLLRHRLHGLAQAPHLA